MKKFLKLAALWLSLSLACSSALAAPPKPLTAVRLTVDEEPIAVSLATGLGYFTQEGLAIEQVDLEKLAGEDYLMQESLMQGRIDASYHWFNHVVYGHRHGFPIKAVMMFNDAPGMTVLVARRVQDQIRGVADFRGRHVAEGAGYGTKSVITHYMAARAGLAPSSYTSVMLEKQGRTEAVIQGLKDGQVDVMTFEEPVVSALKATGLVSPLLDLNSRATSEKNLGAAFPAQSLMVSPKFIQAHPQTVQHLVNAFVRTMRFINSHSVDEVIAALPPEHFKGKDRDAEIKLIRDTISTQAQGHYALPPAGVDMVVKMNLGSAFDQSAEGQWRAGGQRDIKPAALYDNRFVDAAMKAIH